MAEDDAKIEITWQMVQASTEKDAEGVQWRRQHLNSQRQGYRANLRRHARWAVLSQAIIIVLGFVASVAAIFSKGAIWSALDDPEVWSFLNVMTPLLISAATGIFALFDFRGAYVRNSSAYAAISAIKSEIDCTILFGLNHPEMRITPSMLKDWDTRTDLAVTQHVKAWERSITDIKPK